MQPYKGKNQYQQDNTKKPKYKKKNQACPSGFLCDYLTLLQRKCKSEHPQEDIRMSDEYIKIQKNKRTVIYFEKTKEGHLQPRYLLYTSLPIQLNEVYQKQKIEKQQEEKEKDKDIDKDKEKDNIQEDKKNIKQNKKQPHIDVYYQAEYLGVNKKDKKIKLRILKQIGQFGQVEKQKGIYRQYGQLYYFYDKIPEGKQILTGTIKNNWERKKVLTNSKGLHKPFYFGDVVQTKYPLSEGCTVKYSGAKNRNQIPKISDIIHDRFKFSGIIQLDKKGIFYVRCRNWKHDNLDLPSIPRNIINIIPDLDQFMPYSLLKTRDIAAEKRNKVNGQLKKYLFKGIFNSWPDQFINPIGSLEEQFSTLSVKSLKQAVIYQLMINPIKHSDNEKKKSQKLVQQIQKQNLAGKQKALQQFVFTMDSSGTSCHDDALSIQKTKEQNFKIGVHISDVDQYIPQGSYIDQQAKRKDKTMYIKGYYNPMFYGPLMKLLSLSSGNNKLTYSLFFQMSQNGLINFKTVQFKQTCINIKKNYFHSSNLKSIPELTDVFKVHNIISANGILKENTLTIEEQFETETIVDQLMLLSAMIPTFMLKLNYKRIQSHKKLISEFMTKMIERVQLLIDDWQKQYKLVKQKQRQLSKVLDQKKKITNAIMKQVDLQIRKFRQQIKQAKKKQKVLKQKQKKQKAQKNQKGEPKQKDQKDQESSQSDDVEIQISKTNINDEQIKEQQKFLKQEAEQAERQKKVKQILNKKIQVAKVDKVQDQQPELSTESQTEAGDQMQGKKMSSAQRALNYLTKVFNILQVDIKWESREQIRRKFIEARKYNPSQLFQQFMKRMYIINSQHFKYILKIKNGGKKRQEITKKADRYVQPGLKSEQNKNNKFKQKIKAQVQTQKKVEIKQERQKQQSNTQKGNKNKQMYKIKDEKKLQTNINQQSQKKIKIQQSSSKQIDLCKKQQLKDNIKSQCQTQPQTKVHTQTQNKQEKHQAQLGNKDKDKFKKKNLKFKQRQNINQGERKLQQTENEQKVNPRKQQQKQKNIVAFGQNLTQKSTKNQSKQLGFKNGMNIYRKYEHLAFKIFQNAGFQVNLIETGFITLRQNQKLINLPEQVKKNYLKNTIFGIKQGILRKLPKQLRSKCQKNASTRAEQHINMVKQKNRSNESLQQVKKIIQLQEEKMQKVENLQELYENGIFVNMLKKLQRGTQQKQKLNQKKGEQKDVKPKRQRNKNIKQNKEQAKKQAGQKIQQTIQEKSQLNKQQQLSKQSKQILKTQKVQNVQDSGLQTKIQQTKKPQQNIITSKDQQADNLDKNLRQQGQNQKNQQAKIIVITQNKLNLQGDLKKKPNAKPLSKKQSEKKLIQQKKKKLQQQISQKHSNQLKQVEQKVKKQKEKIQEVKKQFKESLKNIDMEYNILQYLMDKLIKKSKKSQKAKKEKKKDNKQKQKQIKDENNQEYLNNVDKLCNIILDYFKKCDIKPSLIKKPQLESYLKEKIKVQKDQIDDIEQLNKQFTKICRDQSKLLKWNNPIRSYEALQVLRLLKDFEWVFNGQISPIDILIDYKALKMIKTRIQSIEKQRIQKMESQQLDRKHKQANRQINKIQFYYKIKNIPNQSHKFLNVTSPSQERAKFVFHPTLGEIEVKNYEFQQKMFQEVQGKFQTISQFPIQVKARLIK